MKSVIVGTAGHIDHGKTALVKALTGIDADRLDEEKRRGITIDIGFAHLELPAPNGDILRLGFVDVPGHERFVRNMLAGVGGIDLVLLVIAADEGIKPQTREHFDICRLLAVRRGITVLTKTDAVDPETLEVARLEVANYLRGSFLDPAVAPMVAVSSLTGAGLEQLRTALAKVASEVSARDSTALVRLPIDRVFTMKGFGTVVTGTLVSGAIRKEDELEVFPSGRRVRVRGVQVHGASAERALAGQRTALNLAGIPTEDLARGMMLAPAETFSSTSRVDALVSLLSAAKPLKDGARVHFHAHTMETITEVRLYGAKQLPPGEEGYAQLRLAAPALLLPGDRFILRQLSPVVTIGGGVVLENAPPAKIGNREQYAGFLGILSGDDPSARLLARVTGRGMRGLTIPEAIARTGWKRAEIATLAGRLADILQVGDVLLHRSAADILRKNLLLSLDKFHQKNPLVPGISKEELRGQLEGVLPSVFEQFFDEAIRTKKLELAGELARLPGRGVVMKDEEAEAKKIIEQAFAAAALQVPSLWEVLAGLKIDKARAQKIVTLLLRDKVLIKISEELVFHHSALTELRQKLAALKSATPKIDVARFKNLAGVSRKYAIPLLEYLDRERVTRRVGDERVIL
ncbi:MAG: selenocysteine-specific translation elongation factor [Terriglobales bacterium]